MPEFIAQRRCALVGHDGIVHEGERVALTERQARYYVLKGWIAPAPEDVQDPAPEDEAAPEASAHERRRRQKG